jgi:1-phosphofructokinase family hexose kinase
MIVAVNPNTAIDRVLFVPRFELGKTIRATQVVGGMGGKANDAAWILGELGYRPLVLGFAAGDSGRTMQHMLEARGVTVDFTWVGGTTRLNTVIVSRQEGAQTTITAEGLDVSAGHLDDLCGRYARALEEAQCVIIGGSLPKGVPPAFYAELIGQARTRGTPVVFDASGPGLRAGVGAAPTLVKPNRDELEALAGRALLTRADMLAAARDLLARGIEVVVATLGGEGALAVMADRAYHIPPIPVRVVNAAGAGDGVLAGAAVALAEGRPIEEGLRLGFAAATAVLLTPGTADCRREDVERFAPQVRLVPLD